MATIRQDNILVSLDFKSNKTKQELEAIRNNINAIEDAGPELKKALIDAFETDIVNQYAEAVAATGVEIHDTESFAEGLKEGLREAFDTSDPDEYAKSLSKVSSALSEGKVDLNDFTGSLSSFDKKTDESQRKSKSFFGGLPGLAKSGLAATAAVVATAAAAIAAIIVGIFAGVGAAVIGVFNRAVERVPSVKKNFEDLQKQLRRIGDYVAAQLAPTFNKLIDIAQKFLESIDLTKVLDAFNSLFITVESLTESFLGLFGIDFDSFGESAGGVFNFLADLFTDINRQFAGFSVAIKQILNNLKLFFTGFSITILQSIDALLPGKQFDQAIKNLFERAVEIQEELFPSIGAAFQSGVNEFNKKLEAARATYDDFDLFRGFDKVDQTLKTVVGSIQFYRDQIQLIRADAEKVAPELASQLLTIADDLERGLASAEREIQQRIDKIRGIVASPLGVLESDRTIEDKIEDTAIKQAQKYADALITASKAVANKEIAPRLVQLAEDVQRQINEGDLVITPSISSSLEELNRDYQDSLDIIEKLEKVYKANADKRASDLQRQRERVQENLDAISQLVSGIDSAFNNVADSFAAGIDRQIQKLDELVEAQEDRVDKALVLAERGNAEILQLEEQRLEKLLDARERALQRERDIAAAQLAINQGIAISQGIVALTRAFAEGNVIGGIAASIALAGSLAALVITLSDTFSSIPTFYKGTERVEGHRHQMKIIGVHGDERIFKADHNREIDPRHSNERVLQLYKIGRIIEENPSRASILAETGKINADSVSGLDNYDYSRIEGLLSENTSEIRRLNKKFDKLNLNVTIGERDIHKANRNAERKAANRKSLLA